MTSPDGRLLICPVSSDIVALSTATGIMLWKIHNGLNRDTQPAVGSDSRFLYKLRVGEYSNTEGDWQYGVPTHYGQDFFVQHPYPAVTV